MHVISYKLLREFSVEYPESREPLKAWQSIADVRAVYPHADAVGSCTVFNVMGNNFRLVTRIDYDSRIIYTKKGMTHAEYSGNPKHWQKACECQG